MQKEDLLLRHLHESTWWVSLLKALFSLYIDPLPGSREKDPTPVAIELLVATHKQIQASQKIAHKKSKADVILTITLARGNLSARNLVLTPTEQPTSRMSAIPRPPEFLVWWSSIAWSQFPLNNRVASSRDAADGIARLIMDMVAASTSAAACYTSCLHSVIILSLLKTLVFRT